VRQDRATDSVCLPSSTLKRPIALAAQSCISIPRHRSGPFCGHYDPYLAVTPNSNDILYTMHITCKLQSEELQNVTSMLQNHSTKEPGHTGMPGMARAPLAYIFIFVTSLRPPSATTLVRSLLLTLRRTLSPRLRTRYTAARTRSLHLSTYMHTPTCGCRTAPLDAQHSHRALRASDYKRLQRVRSSVKKLCDAV
jgi:hypothetical protein